MIKLTVFLFYEKILDCFSFYNKLKENSNFQPDINDYFFNQIKLDDHLPFF